MEYDNEKKGVLFSNKERKEQNPNAPDYTGNIQINGVEYWLSAWVKTSKNGNQFMSLAVKEKEDYGQDVPDVGQDVPF